MRQYDAKQSRNRQLLDGRIRKLYQTEPRFEQIDRQIADLGSSQAILRASGDLTAHDILVQKMAELRQEREELLQSFGLNDDYMSMPCSCPDCKDTGFINGVKCHCFKQAEIDLLYSQSNMHRILREENFDHFNLSYYPKDMMHPLTQISAHDIAARALEDCKQFVAQFDDPDASIRNLLFIGYAGVGKTFLSHCIARELIQTGHSVIYFMASELFDTLRKITFDKDQDTETESAHIFACDLLIIDDLGSEFPNSFTVASLFDVINRRLLSGKSTIISTNLKQDDLTNHYSERVTSRLFAEYKMINLIGEDIRLRKKLSRKATLSY